MLTASKGNDFALGIRANGTLWGWGINTNGQLGDGDHDHAPDSGADRHGNELAHGERGHITCRRHAHRWHALGVGLEHAAARSATAPPRSAPLRCRSARATDWANAVAGATHCVAVKTDGTLWAWGSNSSGQVGQGTTTPTTHSTPMQIGTATTWQTVGGTVECGR